jgi:hypothetical protein
MVASKGRRHLVASIDLLSLYLDAVSPPATLLASSQVHRLFFVSLCVCLIVCSLHLQGPDRFSGTRQGQGRGAILTHFYDRERGAGAFLPNPPPIHPVAIPNRGCTECSVWTFIMDVTIQLVVATTLSIRDTIHLYFKYNFLLNYSSNLRSDYTVVFVTIKSLQQDLTWLYFDEKSQITFMICLNYF